MSRTCSATWPIRVTIRRPCPGGRARWRWTWSEPPGGRAFDGVRNGADAVDLELDGLARLDPAVELQAAAAGHGSGRDDVAGLEALARGRVGEHVADVVRGAGGRAL